MALMGLLLRAQQARAAHHPDGHGLPPGEGAGDGRRSPERLSPSARLVNKSRSDAKGLRERRRGKVPEKSPLLPSEIHPHRH